MWEDRSEAQSRGTETTFLSIEDDDGVQLQSRRMMGKGASMVSSSVNLLNNIVGAGFFSMPWCLAQATLAAGFGVFVLICALNLLSFVLLARCSAMTGSYSYLDIGTSALVPRFGAVAQVTAMCYATGSLISYVVLAQNFLLGGGTGVISLLAGDGTFLGGGGLGARAVVGCAFSLLFFLPLSLLRAIESLQLTSWLALFATCFAGGVCVYEWAVAPAAALTGPEAAAAAEGSLRSTVEWAGLPMSLWSAVPIINVAFTAHYNAPRYYFELSHRSVPRYLRATGVALLSALALYLTVGVSGYLSFGAMTSGDVLENFSPTYPLAIGARLALLVVLISCYPKVQHCVREGIIRLAVGKGHTTDTLPFATLALITAAVVACSTLIGVVCDRIEVVLAYKGAIFGSLMVYILPALMYTALTLQRTERRSERACASGEADGEAEGMDGCAEGELSRAGAGATGLRVVVVSMLSSRAHLASAVLLLWGAVSGILGVGVTIEKQMRGV